LTVIYIYKRRNCLVKQIIEGKIKGQIEVTRRRGRRRKKLLDDLKDRGGYCQLKEEALLALCGGIVLEEALDLSFDRLLMMMMNPSDRTMVLGSTKPLTENSTRNISWGVKSGRCISLTTLPPSRAVVT
jgi:hypothetical protein